MLVFETQVFQFGLDTVQTQTVGQRSIDIKGFTCNFILFAGEHGAECTHVVQAVGYLYQDNPDVIVHCEQELLEVLCLRGGAVAEDTSGDFCQPVDDLCYFRAEQIFNIFYCIVRIFYHVVQ